MLRVLLVLRRHLPQSQQTPHGDAHRFGCFVRGSRELRGVLGRNSSSFAAAAAALVGNFVTFVIFSRRRRRRRRRLCLVVSRLGGRDELLRLMNVDVYLMSTTVAHPLLPLLGVFETQGAGDRSWRSR
jgi:hypothetical protein